MDIFEFALEQEKLAGQYYRQLAEKANNHGLRSILNMLAEEEGRHYAILELMKINNPVEITETNVLSNARDVFNIMRGSPEEFSFNISEVDLYNKAIDMEVESRDYYLAKVQEVELLRQKELFEALAKEENKHFILLESICDFISEPDTFLENAEFFHLQEED